MTASTAAKAADDVRVMADSAAAADATAVDRCHHYCCCARQPMPLPLQTSKLFVRIMLVEVN
jgi:hypothetical protein